MNYITNKLLKVKFSNHDPDDDEDDDEIEGDTF